MAIFHIWLIYIVFQSLIIIKLIFVKIVIHTTNWGFNDSWLDMLWSILKYIKSFVSMANCTNGFKPLFAINNCEFRSFSVKFVHNAANIKLYWFSVNSKSAICKINYYIWLNKLVQLIQNKITLDKQLVCENKTRDRSSKLQW